MKKEEYETLNQPVTRPSSLMVSALDNSTKTLIYGYDVDRNTHHVFQNNGILHSIVYDYNENVVEHLHGEELDARKLIPNKRIYPERSDFLFLQNIKNLDIGFTMLAYEEARATLDDNPIAGFTGDVELNLDEEQTYSLR